MKPKARQSKAVRAAWRFGWLAAGLLVAITVALTAVSRLEIFGAGFHVNFALVLGVLGTIGLGVGLMALSFYSDRSGADDEVANRSDDAWTRDQGPR
jgi:hypothetical protein